MTDAGLIVIGSGPAGVSAAEAFCARRPDDPVRILTADNQPSYQRPPESDGATVGVLTCNADDDYDHGEELITAGKPPPVAMS
ncbi:hypothetical protein C6A85_000000112500 [Mycobacterium sp. ITM-2017-0098]|nr:hypothetical protein C6A85_000000112500 [Mycobacterium sp. ITM-2017-0098]